MSMRAWWLLALATTAGLVLRLYGVDRSLWLDEFSTWWCVRDGAGHVASRVASFQGQSPLYYYVAWLSVTLFGSSEVALRIPSLLSSVMVACFCWASAATLGGARAGLWAGALAWLSFADVQSAVNARPYELAILGTSVMTFGYLRVIRSGSRGARATFAGGVALQFCAHFVMVLPAAGLALVHLLVPRVQGRYPRRNLLIDLAWVVAAVAWTWPFIAAAAGRPQHLTWLPSPRHADIAALLAPFALPLVMSGSPGRLGDDSGRGTLALGGSIAGVLIGLEASLAMHADLVTARYLQPMIVPAAVLSGAAIARLKARDVVLAVSAFAAINGANVGRTLGATGTFSGLGVEDWRSAAAAAARAVVAHGATVTLLRSGFMEESNPHPGSAPPATQAVLNGPGAPPFPSPVISLTYRWSEPDRARYFSTVVAPAIQAAPACVLVAQHAADADGVYSANVARWVNTGLDGRYTVEPIALMAGVDVYVFLRRKPKAGD